MLPVTTSSNTAFTTAHKQQGAKAPKKDNIMDTLFELFYVFGLLSIAALLACGFVRYVLGIEIE